MMLVGMMSVGYAADTTPAPADASITITNLDDGDTVNLYQVLHWVSGDGWRLTPAFSADETSGKAALNVENVNKLIAPVEGQGTIELTKADLEAIATYAKNNHLTPVNTSKTVSGTSYSFTTSGEDGAGMYLALVEPFKAGTIYNPMVVSADYTPEGDGKNQNRTNTLSALANMGSSSVAKKETVTIEKTEPKITNDINDEYTFTISTTIPVYSASFSNTYFNISDTMSSYLSAVGGSLTIKDDDDGTVTPSSNTFAADVQSFTIGFDDTFIKNLASPKHITITYKAKLNVTAEQAKTLTNVHEENNKVTVEFPNNPKDDSGKTVLKDETREYTFTIDGQIFGSENWETSEVIKVGLDQDGYPIEEVINYHSGETHAALNGATFQLYTALNAAGTDVDTTKPYTNEVWDGSITTANDGRLYMPGLDAGTYYLKELTAPAGYIKDQNYHTINIAADITEKEYTEYYTIDAQGNVTWSSTQTEGSTAYTYKVPTLNSYTVTVDNSETTYTMTLQGPSISSVTASQDDAEIVNTKGVELPSTGGMGTTILYVGGSILVILAAILLITKRRMNAED